MRNLSKISLIAVTAAALAGCATQKPIAFSEYDVKTGTTQTVTYDNEDDMPEIQENIAKTVLGINKLNESSSNDAFRVGNYDGTPFNPAVDTEKLAMAYQNGLWMLIDPMNDSNLTLQESEAAFEAVHSKSMDKALGTYGEWHNPAIEHKLKHKLDSVAPQPVTKWYNPISWFN